MKVLGLDTSTSFLAIGVVENHKILADFKLEAKAVLAQKIIAAVNCVLSSLNLKLTDIDGFGIASGPGSFTGLRVGFSTLKGMALPLKTPIAAISNLEALAYGILYCQYPIAPVLDAKRKEFFVALYETREGQLEELLTPRTVPYSKLFYKINQTCVFVGPEIELVKQLAGNEKLNKYFFLDNAQNYPSGASIALLAEKKLLKNEVNFLETLEPFYVQRTAFQTTEEKNKV